MWLRWFLGALALAVSCVLASATGQRVLVVLDGEREPYAAFLESLGRRGYDVTLRTSADAKQDDTLFQFGERAFDHVALLVPELKGLKGALTPQSLVHFAEDGGNLFVALSPRLSEAWRDLSREFGLEFAERDSALVDHFGFDAEYDAGDHTAVRVGGERAVFAPGGVANAQVFSAATRDALRTQPLTFRSIAHWVGPNPLAFPLLTPPSTAYVSEVPTIAGGRSDFSASGLEKIEPVREASALLAGFDSSAPDATAALASAVQLRTNSARVVFLGSIEMLQDAFFGNAARSVQRAVVEDMLAWTFQERGVLRVTGTQHERVRANDADVRPDYEEEVGVAAKMYRIKDEVFFALDLQHFDGAWRAAPTDLDLQLAVTMLDPYVTLPLVGHVDGDVARYQGSFRLPDRHGVFTLRVNWKRHGWTYVVSEDVVPVRPFNHDDYPRMLSSSWPYLAGAFSTMAAFAVFSTLWLLLPREKVAGKAE